MLKELLFILLDINSQLFNIVLLGNLQLGWFTQLKSIKWSSHIVVFRYYILFNLYITFVS